MLGISYRKFRHIGTTSKCRTRWFCPPSPSPRVVICREALDERFDLAFMHVSNIEIVCTYRLLIVFSVSSYRYKSVSNSIIIRYPTPSSSFSPKFPLSAAWEQVSSFQGHPFARHHCSTSRRPASAAREHVSSFHMHPLSLQYSST